MAENELKTETNKQTFSKAQIVKSKRYYKSKDLLNAILDESISYSLKDIDSKIENFLKSEVK